MSMTQRARLASALWPTIENNLIHKALVAVAGSLLLWASAKISVPFWPVPMTMQVFVVLALGLTFGGPLAAAIVLLYLAEGAAGLPVFQGTPEKGVGLAYMMGPTGGYLLGFLAAAWTTGRLADGGYSRHPVLAVIAALVGVFIVYVPGLFWLGTIVGWDKPVLAFGFYPFIAGDIVKALLAALLVTACWRLTRQGNAS